MPRRANRRKFLQTTVAGGVGFWVAGGLSAQESKSANERIRFACIGIGGKGSSDSQNASNNGDVVAICDIDEGRLDNAAMQRFPKAQKFVDFRKMLDEMAGSIDAVTVSTPDHIHAVAAAMAMRNGKHVYCQKPMTHSIYEARTLAQIARDKKVVTQMGNQGTSEIGVRKAAEVLRAGTLGKVSEFHVWTNRPIWPQGDARPAPETPPDKLHWELFLGPAPFRPYSKGYHPFAWRGWWDFGTGALGDMACHTMNMPFMGLDLREPTSVEAETSGHNKDSYPARSKIRYEFAATASRPALTMFWYDGGNLPPKEVMGEKSAGGSGCLVVGEKGKLYSPNDYGAKYELIGDIAEPTVEFRQPAGAGGIDAVHFKEFANAIRGGEPTMSNFPDYAGPLTETVLLGNLAVWAGKKIEWDAKNLKATNAPEVEPIIKREYRAGYTL
jgi:predicted dehydrogenase